MTESEKRSKPMSRHRRPVDVSMATFLRALAALALVWAWLLLWQWVLVAVVAIFLAIALDPVVRWLESRRVPRHYASPLLVLLLVAALIGFLTIAGASLAEDSRLVGERISTFVEQARARLPEQVADALTAVQPSKDSIVNIGRSFAGGLVGLGVALVLTVYFLIDGRRTYTWAAAFATPRMRAKVHETAAESSRMIAAYVRGNLITSTLCAVVTWITLTLLGVPAALLLGLLAGVLDLVPVIGFFLSAGPAVLLGFAVSPTVAALVAGFYLLYNLVENYYIQPKVYGRELALSDLAVIASFLVGAELGGVLGALIALPIAAAYPIVERIWRVPREDVAQAHERLASQPEQ
jgi:predicted PurR-regulated permease PerM